ncbi:hypothetical protein Tco_0769114, partial [Tanacetum coccineum]
MVSIMNRGFLDSGGRKNNHRKKASIDTGTSLMSELEGTLNDATPRVDVVNETVEKEKLSHVMNTSDLGSYPSLPTQETASADNAPCKSSYANVTGKPSGKKLNFRTFFTPRGNEIDVVVLVESIRAISADEKKTLIKPSQTSRGVLVGTKIGFKPQKEYRTIPKKPTTSSSSNKKNGV